MSGDLDHEHVFDRRRYKRASLSRVLQTLIALAEQDNASPLLVADARAWLAWAKASESVTPRETP